MRSWLGLPHTRVSALALLSASAGISSAAIAADDRAPAGDPGGAHRSPNLTLGAGVGYANHWSKSYEVDVVSGASAPPVQGSNYSESGIAMNTFADFAAVDLGRGNLGLTAGFSLTAPKTFMNIALVPRYRWRFPLMGTALRSVEPWVGLGVAFAFRDRIDKDYYLWLPLSAGCDVALGSERLYAGVAVDLNTINPKGTTRHVTISGERHQYDARMDNLAVLLRLSYLVF